MGLGVEVVFPTAEKMDPVNVGKLSKFDNGGGSEDDLLLRGGGLEFFNTGRLVFCGCANEGVRLTIV